MKTVPITLVTGYLGSGKTTLINNINLIPQGYKVKVENITANTNYILLAWWSNNRQGMKITNLQIEASATASEYTQGIAPQTSTANADGTVDGLTSVSPNIQLLTNNGGVTINCEYNRDINKAFAELTKLLLNN